MDKQMFLKTLAEKLQGLPQSDIKKSLEYYSEIIDDRMEDGASEEEAVGAMESPEETARQILMEMSLPKVVKAKVRPLHPLKPWELVLLILGSPVWFPLLLTAALLFLVAYLLIWVLIVTLYAVDISFFAGALAGIVQAGISLATLGSVQALFYAGAGLVCFGIGLLLLLVFNRLSKKLVILSQKFVLWAKSRFVRKGESM